MNWGCWSTCDILQFVCLEDTDKGSSFPHPGKRQSDIIESNSGSKPVFDRVTKVTGSEEFVRHPRFVGDISEEDVKHQKI